MPHQKILLQLRTAEIQITVFQADVLSGFGVVNNFKRRRLRFSQHPQLRHINFNFSGGNLAGFALALPDCTGCRNHPFRAECGCLLKYAPIRLIAEGELHDACFIPQIHKDEAAQVTLTLHPAADGNRPSHIRNTERSAEIAAAEIL